MFVRKDELSITEAAKLLDITRNTVHAAIRRGTIKSRRYPTGRRVPLLASVLAYGEKHRKIRAFEPTRPFPSVTISEEPWSSDERRAVHGWMRDQKRAGYLTGGRLRAVNAILREVALMDILLTAIPESGDIPVPRRIQKRVARLLKQK